MTYQHMCNKCHKTFESDRPRGWVCPDCRAKWYMTKTTEKCCIRCASMFVGTAKQTLCPDCRAKRGPYKFKRTHKITFKCKHCGNVIKTVEKNDTLKHSDFVNYTLTCTDCKEANRKRSSIRMTVNNPSYKGRSYEEVLQTRKPKHVPEDIKTRNKEKNSLRLKEHNPMKNPAIKAKMLATKATRHYTYKTGQEHHLWKGNRTVARQIKLILNPWKKRLMAASNFTCTRCGARNCTLNVHHLKPYREIQAEIFARYGINDPSKLALTDEKLVSAFNDIVAYHNNHPDIGIVVCESCHASIDPYFKPRKKK